MSINQIVNSAEAKAAQEDYFVITSNGLHVGAKTARQSLDFILHKISDLIGKQDPRISIVFGNEPASYKQDKNGKIIDRMTPDKVTLLQNALEDPKSLNQSLQIFVDGKAVYHADREGNVLRDNIGLRTLATQQVTPATDLRAESITLEGLQKQIDELVQVVGKNEKALASLTEVQQKVLVTFTEAIDKINASVSSAPARTLDPTLKNWLTFTGETMKAGLDSVHKGIFGVINTVFTKADSRNFKNEIKASVEKELNKLSQQFRTGVNVYLDLGEVANTKLDSLVEQIESTVKSAVQDELNKRLPQIKETVNTLGRGIAETKDLAVSYAAELLAKHFGQEGNGVRKYETVNYTFAKANSEDISIFAKDGRGLIFQNGQFLENATQKDIERLSIMAGSVIQDFSISNSQAQSRATAVKR